MDDRFNIILFTSLLLSIGLIAVAFGVHSYLDHYRIQTIEESLNTHQLDALAAVMREEFASMHGVDSCDIRSESIFELREKVRDLGSELTRYGRTSVYRDRMDYLMRSYALAQLELYALVERTRADCGSTITPVVFFYRIDHPASERQGIALEEAIRDREDAISFVFDIDYPDEPLLEFFKSHYDISEPTIIIEDEPLDLVLSQQEITDLLDFYSESYGGVRADYTYVTRAAGVDEAFLSGLLLEAEHTDDRVRGDARVVASRITGQNPCGARDHYLEAGDPRSLLTLASLRCEPDYRSTYGQIASSFEYPLSAVLENLSQDEPVSLRFEPYTLSQEFEAPENFTRMIIGSSGVTITNQTITTQSDRVTRDWLSGQLADPRDGTLLSVFSERFTLEEEDLRGDIGWHEGARLSYIENGSDADIDIATTTLVAREGDRWYAPDENGVFRFEVPLDKVLYPSNIFLTEGLVVIEDTHGANMIVSQAVRSNASVVLACCDHPGKIHAAHYLSERGVTSVCMTDRFIAQGLGTPGILGSPPIVTEPDGVRIGHQPIEIDVNETIIAANATLSPYALWYYTTPSSYFEKLPFRTVHVTLDDFDQQERIVRAAREHDASVIATRVFSRSDHEIVSAWLDEDHTRRAVLFHSTAYPYGFELLRDYPNQAAFGDSDPIFI